MIERQARILIVDDEPDALVILRHVLSRAGHQVITAYGGPDALRKLEKQRFDLVLTDLAMPKVSGVEIIDRLKNDPDRRRTPVVAITAYMWDYISQCANNSGCDAFLYKPVDAKRLLQEVDRWLQAWPGEVRAGDGLHIRHATRPVE